MHIEPLFNRVLIKQDSAAEKVGMLYVPQGAAEQPQTGVIVASSTECKLSKGDKVLFGKYSGTKVMMEGTEYIIMKDEDLLGVIHE